MVLGIGAAAILGGSAIGAALLGGGGKSSKVDYSQVPETEEAIEAQRMLMEMATGPLPDIPLRGTAQLPQMGEERVQARTTAMEMIQPQDIFSLPEVQGIIQEAMTKGDLLTNRLGRALQASGSFTSTGGRDVLGRAVTDVQKSLAASLAPFASEERSRRASMIPVLESLGLTEEMQARGVSQSEMDALYNKLSTEWQLPLTYIKPFLDSILGNQPAVQPFIQGQQPSMISQMAPILGPMLTAAMQGGGGGQTITPGQANQLYQTGSIG